MFINKNYKMTSKCFILKKGLRKFLVTMKTKKTHEKGDSKILLWFSLVIHKYEIIFSYLLRALWWQENLDRWFSVIL